MGEFNSGIWIVGISIYLFGLFLVVHSILNVANEYELDRDGVYASDPGFLSSKSNPENTGDSYRNITISTSTSQNLGSIFDTLGFITGFGATSIGLGIPSGYIWIFSFLFFWIPFFMLAWAIYMALPFIH